MTREIKLLNNEENKSYFDSKDDSDDYFLGRGDDSYSKEIENRDDRIEKLIVENEKLRDQTLILEMQLNAYKQKEENHNIKLSENIDSIASPPTFKPKNTQFLSKMVEEKNFFVDVKVIVCIF